MHKVASHDYFLLLRRRRDVDVDFDDDYYFDVDEENQSPGGAQLGFYYSIFKRLTLL